LTRIFALRFFQEWIWQNAQDSIELRSQFSFGLNAFGSTINESLAQVNQVVPNNRFFSWQGMAQWTRNLAKDTLLLVRANAQLADRALVPSEQFALGGEGSVQGYSQDFLLTDNGIKASAEVQLPGVRVFRGKGVIQVVPFVDWGMVWNSSGRANPTPNSLASVGLGRAVATGRFYGSPGLGDSFSIGRFTIRNRPRKRSVFLRAIQPLSSFLRRIAPLTQGDRTLSQLRRSLCPQIARKSVNLTHIRSHPL
jgi:hemolysin activation/secretion protein